MTDTATMLKIYNLRICVLCVHKWRCACIIYTERRLYFYDRCNMAVCWRARPAGSKVGDRMDGKQKKKQKKQKNWLLSEMAFFFLVLLLTFTYLKKVTSKRLIDNGYETFYLPNKIRYLNENNTAKRLAL